MELADICMRCEWYIGTQGGGMDQAICFLAKEGYVNTFVSFGEGREGARGRVEFYVF